MSEESSTTITSDLNVSPDAKIGTNLKVVLRDMQNVVHQTITSENDFSIAFANYVIDTIFAVLNAAAMVDNDEPLFFNAMRAFVQFLNATQRLSAEAKTTPGQLKTLLKFGQIKSVACINALFVQVAAPIIEETTMGTDHPTAPVDIVNLVGSDGKSVERPAVAITPDSTYSQITATLTNGYLGLIQHTVCAPNCAKCREKPSEFRLGVERQSNPVPAKTTKGKGKGKGKGKK